MRRLFQNLTKRLQDFIAQRDDLLLLVRCRDEECALVLKQLDAIEEACPDFFWIFVADFVEPASYAQAVIESFQERVAMLAKKLEEAGDSPWPPLPPPVLDRRAPPVTRLRLLFMYARTRIPDLAVSNLVAVLTPLKIAKPLVWRALLRELSTYDALSPWCHHMRIIAREKPGLEVEELPSSQIYPVDFSLAALQRANKEEILDPEVPLADRMQTLLVDATVDYSNRRYPLALAKYKLLYQFFSTVGNQTLLGATLNGMGEVYAALEMREPAIAHFEMAVTAAIEGESNPVLLNVTLNLGNLYLAAKEWREAVEFYIGAEALASALLNSSTKLSCLENIGYCRAELEEYAAAQEAWTNGLKLATKIQNHDAARHLISRLRELYRQARMTDRVAALDAQLQGLPS